MQVIVTFALYAIALYRLYSFGIFVVSSSKFFSKPKHFSLFVHGDATSAANRRSSVAYRLSVDEKLHRTTRPTISSASSQGF